MRHLFSSGGGGLTALSSLRKKYTKIIRNIFYIVILSQHVFYRSKLEKINMMIIIRLSMEIIMALYKSAQVTNKRHIGPDRFKGIVPRDGYEFGY